MTDLVSMVSGSISMARGWVFALGLLRESASPRALVSRTPGSPCTSCGSEDTVGEGDQGQVGLPVIVAHARPHSPGKLTAPGEMRPDRCGRPAGKTFFPQVLAYFFTPPLLLAFSHLAQDSG